MQKQHPGHVYEQVTRNKRQCTLLGMTGLIVLLLIIALLSSSFF